MNDLELLDRYCETCLDYIHPLIFRDVQNRGLVHLVNRLPSNIQEAKAVVRGRLAKAGKCFGDEDINHIAADIRRMEYLRKKLVDSNMADAHYIAPILQEMSETNLKILQFYK